MKDPDVISSGKGARITLRAKPASPGTIAAESAPDLGMVPACLQLKRILVPLDFSEPSQKALRYAIRFAEQFGAEVTLLHVIQPMVYPVDFGYPPTLVETLDQAVRRQIEDKLDSLARQTTPKMQSLIRVGQPYYEITMVAKELGIDLLIITTHGRTGLKHALLGSTAERVVRHAPCPVLTLREREHDFV